MNVFDLRGPEFLEFYLTLLASAVAGGLLLRWGLRGPGGDVSHLIPQLDSYDTAYLAGGPRMVMDATLAGLVHGGSLRVDISRRGFHAKAPLPVRSLPNEQTTYEWVRGGEDTVRALHSKAAGLCVEMESRLRATNLVTTVGQALAARLIPAVLVGLVLAVGVGKIYVGASRGRPVSILVILCLITSGIAFVFAMKPVYRTRAGDRFISKLRAQNSALHVTAATAPNRLANVELALAIALFGPKILSTGDLIGLRQAIWPVNTSSGSGCGSGGGSGCGGGGGCGGGCGGCGG